MAEAALNITLETEEILIQELSLVDQNTPQTWKNKLILGDCLEVLQKLPSASVDLIITSPPYADSRKKTYGGIFPDEYTDWFLARALELKRVLKPEGSFILNIKEKVVDGQRHSYVLNLILGMQQQGWLWTEEYIWHKKIVILANGLIVFEILGSVVYTLTSKRNLKCIRNLLWFLWEIGQNPVLRI